MSLRIRRGTNTERSGIVFDLAELAWTSDTKKLFVGDGITAGGNNILSTSAGDGLVFDNANGGVLKFDLSYLNTAIETETFSLFDNQTHTGITFTHSNGVITASVLPSEANELEIRNLVNLMLDTSITVSNDPTIDLTYLYNENTGVIQTSLVADRVKFYAESLFTSEDATHTNITFTYNETDNVIDAAISDNTIKDLSAALLTDNELHTNISFTYANNVLTAAVSGVLLENNPILQANLDLNNYALVGNGKIAINGALSLTTQSSPPENPQIGEIAIADGISETGWNPLESLSESNYPVYYDGSNWLHLGDYQQKAVFYVDALRTDGYVPTGTIIKPFTTISDAITASLNSGLNIFVPTYIILLNSITEDVVLTENNIFLSSFISSDASSAPTIYGNVTINANNDISPYTKFSISNIRIDANGKDNAIVFEGTNSQLLNLNNVFVNGITTGTAVSLSNSGSTSIVNIDGCTFNVTSTSVIDLQTGVLNLHNSNINNDRIDSSGIILNNNIVNIINSNFDIIESSVARVIEGQAGTVRYSKLSFNTNSNRKMSSLISLIELDNTFILIQPTYGITPDTTSVNEGDTVTFTVTTTEVLDNTTLYWTTVGDVVAADFSDNKVSDSFVINSSTGTITRIISEDALTDGGIESFSIEVRTGSASGPIVSTSVLVSISDTSTSPPTYSIIPDTTSISETGLGSTVVFTVTTTDLPDTTLYWTTLTETGTIDAADFNDNTISGTVNIVSSNGTITRTLAEDAIVGETDSFRIELRTGSELGPVVATSSVINITDTTPSYSISTESTTIIEGGIAAFDITTTNVPDGTILYWTLSNTSTATASDFVENISYGPIGEVLLGITSFALTVSEDATTEGPETFSIELRTDSELGPVVATSPTITISDTSLSP